MLIGERIKIVRESKGLNQRDFASSIKISQPALAMFENGQRDPKDIHIEQICTKYSINEDWLREEKGEMESNSDIEYSDICADIGVRDPKAREAIMKYYKLSDDDKELWWDFMERFLK